MLSCRQQLGLWSPVQHRPGWPATSGSATPRWPLHRGLLLPREGGRRAMSRLSPSHRALHRAGLAGHAASPPPGRRPYAGGVPARGSACETARQPPSDARNAARASAVSCGCSSGKKWPPSISVTGHLESSSSRHMCERSTLVHVPGSRADPRRSRARSTGHRDPAARPSRSAASCSRSMLAAARYSSQIACRCSRSCELRASTAARVAASKVLRRGAPLGAHSAWSMTALGSGADRVAPAVAPV